STRIDLPGVRERVLDIVRELLEELGSHGALPQLSASSSLDRDLGLGSLERVELLTRLENAFGIRLPDTLAEEASTPEELAAGILAARGTASDVDKESSAPRAAAAAQQLHHDSADSIVEKAQTLVEVIQH